MDNNPNYELNSLRFQLQYLQSRIHELENENAKLSMQFSNCVCKKTTGSDSASEASHLIDEIKNQKLSSNDVAVGLKKLSDTGTIHHLPKQYVALKVMYFGPRFYGFASEAQMDPTVESEIFKALKQTRLIFGDKKELKYSRCGRTDKGVSSVGQVISLFLRSNLRVTTTSAEHSAEMPIKESCCEEIDYVKILNRVLPKDIRIIGWSPASVDFSARFSCLSREYKYFFWRKNLDIRAMEIASEKFIGEHDFRNFCKMDAANVHNYKRHIMLFEIFPCSEMYQGDQLWAMKVKGSAFLWHQIRCIVAVLFLIGEGLESPEVIDALLDIKATPRKPQYAMAPEIPLVLESCEFEGLKFMCSIDARKVLVNHLEKECREFKLKAAIFHEALVSCCNDLYDYNQLNIRRRKKESAHIPLMSRPTELSYEERSSKLKVGRGAKNEEIHTAPDIHAKHPTV